jgi:hypothetical protein
VGPVMVAELEADLGEVWLEFGTDHDTNTSGTFTDVNPETRRPDRPVPPMAGTAAIGAVAHLLAAAIEEGRDPSSMSGILADTAYRLLLA